VYSLSLAGYHRFIRVWHLSSPLASAQNPRTKHCPPVDETVSSHFNTIYSPSASRDLQHFPTQRRLNFDSMLTGDPVESGLDTSSASSSDDASAVSNSSGDSNLSRHLELLTHPANEDEMNEVKMAPMFTAQVRNYASSISASTSAFTQYGLLASVSREEGTSDPREDSRLFHSIAAPSSTFICGNQGSGKSHTLSCFLENCLASSDANELPRPLTGVIFHYDTFTSDNSGAICEAATLSSNSDIKVRVLCPPTNIRCIKASHLPPLVLYP